jgi:DNA repair exonuclease SbcCD ATPase subunit
MFFLFCRCVHQGSAEEDGRVKSGDRVVSIDGVSTTGMTLVDVKRMVVGPAGTWVNFVFTRGEKSANGQIREVMVPVDLERKIKAKSENNQDRIFTLEREKLVLIERNRYLQTQLSVSQDEINKSSSALRRSSASVEEIAILQKQLKEMEARASASAASAASAGEEVALLNRKLKEAAALMAKETTRANELAEKLIRSGAFTEQALRESTERNESQTRAHQLLQRENAELRTKLAAAVAEVTRVNQLCAEAHAGAEDAVKERELVGKDLEAARNEIKTIRSESNANAKTISELLNEISGLTAKLQDRGGQTSPTRDTEVQSLKQLCAIHEAKIASLTQQLDQYQAAQAAKSSSSSSIDAGSHPVVVSMQKHIDQLAAEKLQAEQTISSLQQDLHESQTENAQRAGHEKQVKTLTDLSKALRQQLADAKSEIEHLQDANRLLHEQLQRLQASGPSTKSLQSSANEDSLQQALRVANEYREKSDAQFKSYQTTSEQTISRLKGDLQRLQQELDAKEAQMQQQATSSMQSRSLSTHTSSHTETSSHLRSEHVNVVNITRISELTNGETDIDALQRMLQEAEGRIIELELMINKMREEHQNQYKSLSMKVQASEEISSKYRRDHASSETLLIDAKQELSGLRPRYDAALAKLSSMEPQLEKLRIEYSTATSRLSVSEARCNELSSASEGLRARLSVAEQVFYHIIWSCKSSFWCISILSPLVFCNHLVQMCGSLSEEGAALKMFISKLQSQLSDSLSEANGLRGSAKSLEAKVFELMSETQMYRGQIDELQVIILWQFFTNLELSFHR